MGSRSKPIPRVIGGGGLPISGLIDPRYSQSLERGLAILECFTPAEPVLGVLDLAERLGMNSSTTHRYVSTLAALGHLRQVNKRRKYRLGFAVIDVGLSAMGGTSLSEHARPYLKELSIRTGFTISIAVLDGPDVLLVDRWRGTRRGQHQIDLGQIVGSRLPVYCTALGRLLVAQLCPRARQKQIAGLRLVRHGPKTLTSKAALHRELDRAGEEVLVASEEEYAEGLLSIAVPVRSEHEVVAALALDAHCSTISLEDLVSGMGPHLLSAAGQVSARLGYRREDEKLSRVRWGEVS